MLNMKATRGTSNSRDLTLRGTRFPLIAGKDSAIQKRCGPGRITCLIDRAGSIPFVQEGMPKHEDLLRELGRPKK